MEESAAVAVWSSYAAARHVLATLSGSASRGEHDRDRCGDRE